MTIKRFRAPRTSGPSQPVTVVKVPKVVLRDALRLADGDASRLQIQRDGSVLVRNHAREGR
jgi:hypothetical protein